MDLFAEPIEVARAWARGEDVGPNPERVVQRLSRDELQQLIKEVDPKSVQYAAYIKRLSEFR